MGALGLGASLVTPLEVLSIAPTGNWDPATQAMYNNLFMSCKQKLEPVLNPRLLFFLSHRLARDGPSAAPATFVQPSRPRVSPPQGATLHPITAPLYG